MDGLNENGAPAATGNSPPPFLSKTYDMVEDPATDDVVSWSKGNNSFVVWNVAEFARDILPKHFKHNNFSSFVRQLNTYGFRKVDPDRQEFANEGFLRGHKHLLKSINRRKPSNSPGHQQPPQVQNTSVESSVEVGQFGIDEEVESLKRDKNILVQELVKLRQQQQSTDSQLKTVGQRVHLMEQHQQQMMSFLAKAMHSPGFVSQLVHQQNDSNKHISGINKKRRLPSQEESVSNHALTSVDGRIVRYHSLMNEAAKSMLRKILKINGSSRLDSKINHSNGFLIDNVSSPSNVLESESTSSRISEVTLSEALSSTLQSHLPTDSVFQFNDQSSAVSEIQSSPAISSEEANSTVTSVLNSQRDADMPLSQAEGMIHANNVNSNEIKGSDAVDAAYMDGLPSFVEGMNPVLSDGFSSDPDVDNMLDGVPKLPGIDDIFWEQFLSASPLAGVADEISSRKLEGEIQEEQDSQKSQECGWDKMKHMNHITEQMGLLASGSTRG